MLMRLSLSEFLLLCLLYVTLATSSMSCVASDRYMLYEMTKAKMSDLAHIITAIHGRDPTLLKNRTLHDIMIVASEYGYISPAEVSSAYYETDVWGNPFRTSYCRYDESDVYIIESSGPESGTREEVALTLKMFFKHGNALEITYQGFP